MTMTYNLFIDLYIHTNCMSDGMNDNGRGTRMLLFDISKAFMQNVAFSYQNVAFCRHPSFYQLFMLVSHYVGKML